MLASACGLGQHFQDLGHSFSLYGPPSPQITYIYEPGKRAGSVTGTNSVVCSYGNFPVDRDEFNLYCSPAVIALWTLVTLLIELIRLLLKWKYIQDQNYAILAAML